MPIFVGIDYSMVCPCLCIHEGLVFSFYNCKFFYLTDKKKFVRSGQITGEYHQLYTTPEQRYSQIAKWALSKVPSNSIVAIEGYSYASRQGLICNIAECTSVLKQGLYKSNIQFDIVPPTVVKKLATGKGNSSKVPMYESFFKETKFDLLKELNITEAGSNPQSDLVDSYYVVKYIYQKKNI